MDLTAIQAFIMQHLPFASVTLLFMYIGRWMNLQIFTKEQAAAPSKYHMFWLWGRKTLAAHPVVAGLVLGCFWRHPEAWITTLPASCTYFAVAGITSVWGYETVKGIAKRKGINIDALPGSDTITVTSDGPSVTTVTTTPIDSPQADQ